MKKLLLSLTILILLTISSFATFAENETNIKTSEFITAVMKETYGELSSNETKPYLPYAIKAIEEGIILPGEISDYNSDIEKKTAFQILDRIAEKEKKVSKYSERLNADTDKNTPKYIGEVEFDNLLEEFLIKIGKKEKKGRHFTLEEINDRFETQEELEDFLNYQIYLDDRKKYKTFDPAVRESKEFEEKIKKDYEMFDGMPVTTMLDGIYWKENYGGTAERNKTLYDIATILHYHEAVLDSDRIAKISDYDVLVNRTEGSTRFVFAPNYLQNTNDEGYFSIMFEDEPQIDHILGNKFNVTLEVNQLGDFNQKKYSGYTYEDVQKEEFMDDSIPMILREVLKVMYKDRVDELMEEIIKDYKQMMKNPSSTMTKTYMDTELREIVGETFTVSVFGKNGGSIYKVYFEEE